MSIYSSNEAVKESAQSWGTGLYKFKVTESSLHTNGNVMFKIKTWTEEGAEGPEGVYCWLSITSDKQGAKDEINRRLQTLLGKTSIDDPKELVGKAGYVVMVKGEKYLDVYPFGGFYDMKKLSATGKDSSAERVEQALAVKPKVSAPVATPESDTDLPF